MILWFTGPAHIGKTTVAQWAKDNGFAKGICLIGQQLRKKHGVANIAKMENPVAPEQLNSDVKEIVVDFLFEICDKEDGLFIIDGYPRSCEQLMEIEDYVHMTTRHKHVVCFLSLSMPRTVGLSPEATELSIVRQTAEVGLFERIITLACRSIHCLPFEIKVCRLHPTATPNEWMYSIGNTPSISTNSNLSYLIRKHKELDSLYIKRYGISSEDIAKLLCGNEPVKLEYKYVAFLEDMFMRLKEETIEAYDEIHKKFWSDSNMDGRKLRTEMVDILHFWFTIALCLGMEADDIGRIYLEKRKVNIGRINNGKKKGDDDHVGYTKS